MLSQQRNNLIGLRALAAALPPGTPVPVPSELLLELLGEARSGTGSADPLPQVLTQKQAARLLGISVSYLRASSCPKRLLPGNGPRGRCLVRYDRSELLAWSAARRLTPRRRKAS